MKTLALVLFTLISLQCVTAQQFDWILNPVITDAEEISVHPVKNALVRVKKDGLYGVKNQKDEVLIPTIHRSLDISIDQKYVYIGRKSKLNSIKHILNLQGDTLKLDHKLIMNHPWQLSSYLDSRFGLIKFVEKYGLQLETFQNEKQFRKYRIKDSRGKIIIDSLTGNAELLGEGFLAARKTKKGIDLFDKSGQNVFSSVTNSFIKSNGKGLYSFNKSLLNSKFEEIFNAGSNNIILFNGYDLYSVNTKKNGSNAFSLYNLNNELEVPGTYTRFDQIDQDWLILKSKSLNQIYSLKEKEILFSSIGYISESKVNGWVKVNSNRKNYKITKYGAYNFHKKELMFDTVYRKIIFKNDHIVTFKDKESPEDYLCTVYTSEGNELFKINNEEVIPQKYNTFLINGADKVNRIVDHTGKVLLEVDYNYILRIYDPEWVYKINVRGQKVYYSLKDISQGKIIGYNSMERLNHKTMCTESIYIISMDDKYGMYSSEEGIIIPCEYDLMHFNKMAGKSTSRNHSEVVTVLKDGKWGAFINPCFKY